MKPVGPEDSQIYWKRRALVGGIALLILFLLWLLIRPKGNAEEQVASAPAAPAPSMSTPSLLPSASASASASASPSASPSPSAAECPDSNIDVTVTTNQTTYKPGADPDISMAIVNTGSKACERNVGSGANEIRISSGGTQIWSSDDCSTSAADDVQTLEPGEKATVTVSWTRTKSEPGCAGSQPEAEPGTYEAVGRNDKVDSEPATFVLQE